MAKYLWPEMKIVNKNSNNIIHPEGNSLMKKLTTLLAVAAFGVAVTSATSFACDKTNASNTSGNASYTCSASQGATATAVSAPKNFTVAAHDECPLKSGQFAVASMNVSGMTCEWCENNLTERLQAVSGAIMVASISAVDGTAKVIYDQSLAKEADFASAISDDKFNAEIIPAVAIISNDPAPAPARSPKLSNSSGKSSCQYSGKSSGASASTVSSSPKLASKGAGCNASKGSSFTKGSKKTNATYASSNYSHCDSYLTSAEKAKFCSEFCDADLIESETQTEDS